VGAELEHQLEQLEELLSLFDAQALREAQEAVEHQIAGLAERLEVTRQALAQAQAQRRRLARARLLLEEGPGAVEQAAPAEAARPAPPPPTSLPERRRGTDRRKVERRKIDAQPAADDYAAGA
jgi:DNA-binding protein H-NS